MQTTNLAPIGIFDSGIGGLTVAKTITESLPNENILYFGDTAHTPWGDKSLATIQNYAVSICRFLLENHCKCIVIACHTASATVHEAVCKTVGDTIPVFNVIDPVIQYISQHYSSKRIGLIGTKQTIRSNTYHERLMTLNQNIELVSLATPLLVPLIEEGFIENKASHLVVAEYLSHPKLTNIEALILGCTHYPLMKKHINNFYQEKIDIIDTSSLTAETLKQALKSQNLLNTEPNKTPERKFYVSDLSEFFIQTTERLFQGKIHLQPYSL